MMAPPTTSFCASYSTARWAWTDENGLDYVSDGEIVVRANFCNAADTLMWRSSDGDADWDSTPLQVADACHSSRRALSLVASYLEGQGG